MKKSPRKVQRLLYRSGLTNNEIDRLIATIGARRLLAAIDRRFGR
jgi:3-oxoacyl-[acyl-carrier-protein] synthase III